MSEPTPSTRQPAPSSVRRRAKQFALGMVLLALGLAFALRIAGYSWETSALGGGWVLSIPLAITVGLAFTAPAAAEYAEGKMTDPAGKVQQLRAQERAEIKAIVDGAVVEIERAAGLKYAQLLEEVAAIKKESADQARQAQGQINARLTKELAPLKARLDTMTLPDKWPDWSAMNQDFAEMKAAVTQENLLALMKQAYSDMRQAEIAREGIPPAGTADAEEDARVRAAAEHPEEAQKLAWAIRTLDGLAGQKVIKPATAKRYQKIARAAFARDGTIDGVLEEIGLPAHLGLGGGSAPSARQVPKGGGFNPG